jgi:hypothetical protein
VKPFVIVWNRDPILIHRQGCQHLRLSDDKEHEVREARSAGLLLLAVVAERIEDCAGHEEEIRLAPCAR